MPPKQKVDLDLDALAPPNRTVRLRGKVYELPAEVAIDTVVRAVQLQAQLEAAEDEGSIVERLNEMLDLIYDLFRECNEGFEPMTLTLPQVLHILGLILSGMDVPLEDAVREAMLGGDVPEEKKEGESRPPTRRTSRTPKKLQAV